MLTLARHNFVSFPQRNTFLYIQYGEHDFGRVVEVVPEFIEILEKANPTALLHRVDVLPGEGHVPYSCYRDALVALFPDFRIKPGELGQGLGYIEAHYQGLTDRYGLKIETPAEPMIDYGELMLDAGEPEKAIEAFKLASVRYSDSALAYYRLGRAYDAAGKLPEALAAYRQLLKIYPQSNTIQARISELEKSIAQ